MGTSVARTPASFRFQSTLVDELKSKAKACNRSLNSYVENLLISILHPSSNNDGVITPEIQAAIDTALREHQKGEFVRCHNKQDLQTFLNAL